MIAHITTNKAWAEAVSTGNYAAPSLWEEGFIHCSTREQVVDTANGYFAGQSDLTLLLIDETRLSAVLKYEPPVIDGKSDDTSDQRFPHLYGPINLDAVIAALDFPSGSDGTFILPTEVDRIQSSLC